MVRNVITAILLISWQTTFCEYAVYPTSSSRLSLNFLAAGKAANFKAGSNILRVQGDVSNLRLRGGKGGRVKTVEMWEKTGEELRQLENELRAELMSLRVAKQVGGQPGKVNRIRLVKKSIARVLTIHTAKLRAEAFKKIKKDKYKPLDARKNRHWTKAMRLRLTKHEESLKSAKAMRCLRHKVWGAGERPMRRVVGFTSPLEEVKVGFQPPDEDLELRKYPRFRMGKHGRYTATGHIPQHAKVVMERRKVAWLQEKARVEALRERIKERKAEGVA